MARIRNICSSLIIGKLWLGETQLNENMQLNFPVGQRPSHYKHDSSEIKLPILIEQECQPCQIKICKCILIVSFVAWAQLVALNFSKQSAALDRHVRQMPLGHNTPALS